MATTKAKEAAASASWDPNGPCPACKEMVHVYIPPDRGLGGPVAYPALLLHFEAKHGGLTPPAAPEGDSWDVMPPAPEDWKPLDKELLKKQQPQPAGVWPPLRMPKQLPE